MPEDIFLALKQITVILKFQSVKESFKNRVENKDEIQTHKRSWESHKICTSAKRKTKQGKKSDERNESEHILTNNVNDKK